MKLKPKSCEGRGRDLSPLEQRLGSIEYRDPKLLKPYANNPRKHPEAQIIKLMASIRKFGFVAPVLLDEASEIIAGDARVEAATRLALEQVPVIVASHLSPAEARQYRLADNKLAELGKWDPETLAIEISAIIEMDDTAIEILGFEAPEIDVLLEVSSVCEPAKAADPADAQMQPSKNPTSRQGDLWVLGGHRLLCGSSLEQASWTTLLGTSIAAMVFSDPPYNVRVDGHVCGLGRVRHAEFAMASGEMSEAEFTSFLTEVIGKMRPHLKDGALLDLCIDWRHMAELQAALDTNDLSLLNVCVWNKTNGGMGSLYRSKHELVFVAKHGAAPHTNNVQLGKHGRYRTNVWDYAGVNGFGKNRMADLAEHPTVKPVALVADAIRDVTNLGEIVLDAFMGSGTTILAAERTKRRAFGIEIEPTYVDVAIRRWQALTGSDAVLESTGDTFAGVAEQRAAIGEPELQPAVRNTRADGCRADD